MRKFYDVIVTEKIQHTFSIEAENEEEAWDIANEKYDAGKLKPDLSDVIDYELELTQDYDMFREVDERIDERRCLNDSGQD